MNKLIKIMITLSLLTTLLGCQKEKKDPTPSTDPISHQGGNNEDGTPGMIELESIDNTTFYNPETKAELRVYEEAFEMAVDQQFYHNGVVYSKNDNGNYEFYYQSGTCILVAFDNNTYELRKDDNDASTVIATFTQKDQLDENIQEMEVLNGYKDYIGTYDSADGTMIIVPGYFKVYRTNHDGTMCWYEGDTYYLDKNEDLELVDTLGNHYTFMYAGFDNDWWLYLEGEYKGSFEFISYNAEITQGVG